MSLTKYTNSCGCRKGSAQTCGNNTCCNKQALEPPRQGCCESHSQVIYPGICFTPICNVVVTDDPEGFYIKFSNPLSDTIPINSNDVYLYHPAARLMRILSYNGHEYHVELVDKTRAGNTIAKDDCVLVTVQTSTTTQSGGFRCLYGTFVVPPEGSSETIYILNGSAIPVGAVITFAYEGEIGSYVVDGYVGADSSVYAYTVSNAGSGHNASVGKIIDAGCDGSCDIPVEITTSVDICDLTESNIIDSFSGCLNGSPRSGVPAADGSIWIGKNSKWDQVQLADFNCCVQLAGCLKFSGAVCPSNTDQVALAEAGIECFTEAFNAAAAKNQSLPAVIGEYNVTVVDFNPGNRLATISLADDITLAEPLQFTEQDQICLGSCCKSCIIGPEFTEFQTISNPGDSPIYRNAAVFGHNVADLPFDTGVTQYLVGYNNTTGDTTVLELDAAYFAAPSDTGPKLPKIEDPLMLRQKMCNTSDQGCDQVAELKFNYKLDFHTIPENVRVHWELAHYAIESATLNNGAVNPFTNISTQSKASGVLTGPSVVDAEAITSSFGLSNDGDTKIFPFASGVFNDAIHLKKCDCGMSIVWFYVRIETLTGYAGGASNMNSRLELRRRIRKNNWNEIPIPENDPTNEGFGR